MGITQHYKDVSRAMNHATHALEVKLINVSRVDPDSSLPVAAGKVSAYLVTWELFLMAQLLELSTALNAKEYRKTVILL